MTATAALPAREMTRTRPLAKVRLRGVSKSFALNGRHVPVLAPLDFDIGDGEFLCIVGPSGCGKTTLLRILADLETQSAGDVDVTRDATPKGKGERKLNSMVFQEHGVFPWMTVRDNVAFGLKARGMGKQDRYRIADDFIAKVGLTMFRDAYPHQLSGGMKQRVSIARAFANDPEILLMDEPFAALDEQTKLVLQGELLRIWEASRKTVVYVTHSIDEAIVLADRVLVMTHRPGRVKEVIDISEVFERPRHVEQVKSSAEYGDLFGRIWGCLREEVMAHDREMGK
ncbi:ABC transporter ATP-binding protein [Cupriavidus sp. DF5525]|uniref:ABC transporter ATP-binding protein n=1 Tax=Cupriavidus sp. DF5525 TaxID=3160989 RepID=UPI0032DF7146